MPLSSGGSGGKKNIVPVVIIAAAAFTLNAVRHHPASAFSLLPTTPLPTTARFVTSQVGLANNDVQTATTGHKRGRIRARERTTSSSALFVSTSSDVPPNDDQGEVRVEKEPLSGPLLAANERPQTSVDKLDSAAPSLSRSSSPSSSLDLDDATTSHNQKMDSDNGLGLYQSFVDAWGELGQDHGASTTTSTSIALLNLVAIIWGTQHAIIKTVVEDSDAAAFTFLRFSLAALLAAPYLPGMFSDSAVPAVLHDETPVNKGITDTDTTTTSMLSNSDYQKAWRWGLEMGLWMFAGFSFQAIGLLSTTAQRSGFLLYLNVKLVPLFAKLFYGHYISTSTWLSALAAFSGTALLALDGQSVGFNVGDVWSIFAAAASAMFILRLETASVQVPDAAKLNATSLFVVAVLSGFWMVLQVPMSDIVGSAGLSSEKLMVVPTAVSLEASWIELQKIVHLHPLALLYLGGVSTALSNFIQAKAQKNVSAERASIIYSLDPVYGAAFSWLWLGETLGGAQAIVGASLITVAATTNAFLDLSKKE